MTSPSVPLIVNAAAQLDIDVDTLDVALTQRLISLGIQPNDMTSNHFIVADALALPSSQPILRQIVEQSRGEEWQTVLDRVSVALCALNMPNITGRALLQASPTHVNSTSSIIAHAQAYDAHFASVGITRDRFCIKILATPSGMLAARTLESQGIRTLATGIFSVPQALAAAQAGCLYISPYFNEILAHFAAPGTLKVYQDVMDHLMAARMAQIYTFYRERTLRGETSPIIKSASFVTYEEVLAMPALGAQQATILSPTLIQMCDILCPPNAKDVYRPAKDYSIDLPSTSKHLLQIDPLRPDGKAQKFDIDIDYLADDARLLSEAIEEDKETQRRLYDAIAVFIKAEEKAKLLVQTAMVVS